MPVVQPEAGVTYPSPICVSIDFVLNLTMQCPSDGPDTFIRVKSNPNFKRGVIGTNGDAGSNIVDNIPDTSTYPLNPNIGGGGDGMVLHVTDLQVIPETRVIGGCRDCYSGTKAVIVPSTLSRWLRSSDPSADSKGGRRARSGAHNYRVETNRAEILCPSDANVVVLVGQVGVVEGRGCRQGSGGAGVPVKTGNRAFKQNNSLN